ncbi:MAG TPA: hypothetical protein VIW26_10515 [Gemmatimonadales bacterium]|jgi:hypothetical protein
MKQWVLVALPLAAGGCLFAAAGAGAGGGIYFNDRGVGSVVTVPVSRASSATEQTFQELGIGQKKTTTEQDGTTDKREIQGSTSDRDVTVSIQTEGTGSRINVVARKSAVTWDKDFARTILQRIVKLCANS